MPSEGEVDVGAARAQGGQGVEGAGRQWCVGPVGGGFGGGDVHDDGPLQLVTVDEVTDVGGEGRDQFGLAPGVPGSGTAGPDLPVRGGEFGGDGGGDAGWKDTAGGQGLGAFGQGAVEGVVAAEDEVGQRGQTAAGESRCFGHHAGGRVQSRGDGGAAGDDGGGDGASGSDQPHPHTRSGEGRGHGSLLIVHEPLGEVRRRRAGVRRPPPVAVQSPLTGSSFNWMLRKETWSPAPWFWRPM